MDALTLAGRVRRISTPKPVAGHLDGSNDLFDVMETLRMAKNELVIRIRSHYHRARCPGCGEIYCECGDLDDEPTEDECHFGDGCPTCAGADNG